MLVQAKTTKKMILKLLSEAMHPAGLVLASHTRTDTASLARAATHLPHHCALGVRQANRADLLLALLHSLVLNLRACHQARSRTSLNFR